MAKEKIAILGGGMAGLTTAYYLAKTGKYDITVYQMGWRLGGKAASGHDAANHDRNTEHGLHVWFGYYENSFRLLREVYRVWKRPSDHLLKSWKDAFKPQDQTGVGMLLGGAWKYCPVEWPEAKGEPGDGHLPSPVWGAIALLTKLMHEMARSTMDKIWHKLPKPLLFMTVDQLLALLTDHTLPDSPFGKQANDLKGAPSTLDVVLQTAHLWASAFQARATAKDKPIPRALTFAPFIALLNGVDAFVQGARDVCADDVVAQMLADTAHILAATLRGMQSDLIRPNKSFESLDDIDFRAWLLKHGADGTIVETSSIVRIAYDISFQYRDGDVSRPDCAAGSALGSLVRMLAGHKGAMMYQVQTGFGDAVTVPLYSVLKAMGVKFEFFHKVKRLELSKDGSRVERVHMDVQAVTTGKPYDPICTVNENLECWRSAPDWPQLAGYTPKPKTLPDFESHWCDAKPAGTRVISYKPTEETDPDDPDAFSRVVLAVTMAAYKKLNDVDEGMCDELIAQNADFRNFTEKQGLVPTMSVQLWMDRESEYLRPADGIRAAVSGPEYLNIWADMTVVMNTESWPDPTPQSLHYLLGSYDTLLYKEPADRTDTPQRARDEVKASAIQWLEQQSVALWPNAHKGKMFDWTILADPNAGDGRARFDAQYWRANIDPTECCVASHAGTTKYRLYPDESGFDNLILAGEATRHGLNATAVEGAVMSGKAAARHISGEPIDIPGYDFLSCPISKIL